MKVKTFILTFLMMMSCPFLFGQSHWVDPILPGEDVMTVTAKVTLDGTLQSGESYEVAVFNAEDNKLVEVGKFTNHGITELEYHVGLSIPGAAGDRFYFKFFNGTDEYVSLTEIDYVAQQGSHLNLFTIEFKSVAKIGNVVYPSLQEAFAAATDGQTITLLDNITLSEKVEVNKSVVIDLNGKTVTANCKKAFEVYANATIKNGTIWSQQRCVDTRKNVELTLTDVTLEAPTYYSTHKNQQPLTIGGSDNGTKVTMTNVNIDAGTQGYAIISFVETDLTATNSNFSGYSALYVKPGSAQSEFNFVGSTLKGDIGSNDVEGNSFATIATEEKNVTVTLDANSILKSVGENHLAISVESEDNEITVEGDIIANNFLDGSTNVNANTIKVKYEYADELLAEGYATTEEDANGLVEVSGLAEAKIGDTYYATLQDAFNAATVGQTVTVINDVELENTVTIAADKVVTLDLNGKTINTAWENESAEKHYYAFINEGTLTITDYSEKADGVINARGNYNDGTLTLEKGTINAIDHNGGYGVQNREGSKFTMNGGLIATTNENGDIPGNGYDATTVRVDNGAEFIMNGGKINNISNFTIAIDNYGKTTINENAGEVKSVHTTVANHGTMTINGGTFICDGLEGVTAHALWTTVGKTTINGGTFNGKDNYNGFNVDAEEGAVVEINGGNFEPVHSGSLYGEGTITVKGGTFFDEVAEERLADGYVCKPNADGKYGVFLGVAKIKDGAIYGTLAAAITAAQPGNTIYLLTDITENVTVNKNLTIDGKPEGADANRNYTGTMTGNAGLNVTVQNVNFVNGGFAKATKSTTGSYTIKDCTFDGAGTYAYPLSFKGANTVNVENCTVKNYQFGFLYVSSGTNSVSVKDVIVENCPNYAVYFGSGVNSAMFENLTVKNSNNGLLINNAANRAFTMKNCEMENVTTVINHSKGTYTITCTALGVNDLGTAALSEYAVIKGATIEGSNLYGSVQGMVEKAANGQTVKLLSDIAMTTKDELASCDGYPSFVHVEGKAVTVDLNGKAITANASAEELAGKMLIGVFSTDRGGELTLVDSSAEGTGSVTLNANDAKVYSLLCNYNPGCKITVNGGTYTADKVHDCLIFSGAQVDDLVTINGGNFTLGNVGTGENGKPWIFNVLGAGDNHVLVKGGTFNADINRQYWSNEVIVPETHYTVENENRTFTVKEGAEAYVNTGMTTGPYFAPKNIGYATLEEALAKAQEFVDPNVTLLENVELAETLTIEAGKEIILDLNGQTINTAWEDESAEKHYYAFDNKGTLTITDSSTEANGVINARGNFNYGELTLEKGTINGIDFNGGYAVRNYNGATFTMNGGAINVYESDPSDPAETGNYDATALYNQGTATLTAGNITSTSNFVYAVQNEGTLTIEEDMTIKGRGGVSVYNGVVTVEGGNIQNDKENNATGHAFYVAGGELVINEGNITATNDKNDGNSVVYVAANAKATINGGNFTTDEYTKAPYGPEGCNIVITGGTFDKKPEDAYIAKGYGAIANATETLWEVMPVQEQTLVKGWNWYSTYLNIGLNDLTNALGDNGSSIKNSRGNFVDNIGNDTWLGDNELTTISPSEMYLVQTTEECDLKLAADLVNPSEHLINLNTGWSWIGYPSNQEGVAVGVALANIRNPKEGDLIKTLNNGYAEYAFGYWLGTLNTMVPGIGYKYHNTSGEVKTFYYNIETTTRGAVEANVTAENNYWTPNATKYPFNMTMTAVVDGLADGNYEVAAFVNGELRGSARPIYVEALDTYMFFLTIHGEDVEEMSFRLYDIDNDTEYDLSDRINYSNDAMLGTVSEPYVFSRGTTGIGEATMSNVNIYPNPTTTGTEINLEATCDKVEVFNALGVKVAEYQNVDTIDALETAGIYVIRITNNGNEQNCRLVVK